MKLSISKLLETSRFLTTKAGAELRDFIVYVAEFSEQVLRALRNGLTFDDNFNAKAVVVELADATAQIVDTAGKNPTGIIPLRVFSSTYRIASFGWYINADGKTVVTAGFTGSPSDKINVTLVIFF